MAGLMAGSGAPPLLTMTRTSSGASVLTVRCDALRHPSSTALILLDCGKIGVCPRRLRAQVQVGN